MTHALNEVVIKQPSNVTQALNSKPLELLSKGICDSSSKNTPDNFTNDVNNTTEVTTITKDYFAAWLNKCNVSNDIDNKILIVDNNDGYKLVTHKKNELKNGLSILVK